VDNLPYLLPVLACPVGMGLMMWLMMRGGDRPRGAAPGGQDQAQAQELRRLRGEVEALRGELGQRAGPGGAETGEPVPQRPGSSA